MIAQQVEKRNLLSSFFVTILVAMAYQEMILVVKELVRADRFGLEALLLPITFFFVSVRFFVGNQLHLLSDNLTDLPGLAWLYDLMVIITQSIVLVLLGGATSNESPTSAIQFIDYMILLYVVDVLWIVTQWLIGRFAPDWRRSFVPWAWAILNTVLVVALFVLGVAFGAGIHTGPGLLCVAGLNILAFVIDVVLVDYYKVI